MRVFKGFLILLRRNLRILIMYMGIFITLLVLLQIAGGGKSLVSFEEKRLKIGIIDRDQGALAQGLVRYLGSCHDLAEVADDQAVIQEELFYRNLDYVIIIPEDFESRIREEGGKLQVQAVPGTYNTFYADRQIDTFLNGVRVLESAGFSGEDAIAAVLEAVETEAEVKLLDTNGHGGERPAFSYLFRYLPYIMLAVLCYCMSYILIAFRQEDIRRRMLCSAVSQRKQNLQILLAFLVMGTGFWLLCMLLPLLLYGKEYLSDTNKGYYAANSFLMMLTALAISFTLGMLVKQNDATDGIINGAVNVIALGMSFTCGVFVEQELLNAGVRSASRFLPVYWYEAVNDILAEHTSFTRTQITEIWKGYGIQLLFAAAIVCVGMAAAKAREKE
ncbi:MAG: ABC transporter permease [Candidatus Limivivens sp.]|nr:ABC transporter permease [Candidatus Limivivens sp.]